MFLIFISCSIKRKVIKQLYLYEKNQFVNPDKSKNLRALKMWKQNHKIIFKKYNLCDSFIIIDWFDSTYNKQWKREIYSSNFYLCKDTGVYYNYVDSIVFLKINYINQLNIHKILIDSIYNKSQIDLINTGYPLPVNILQLVIINKRKVKIDGINLNSKLNVKLKI